MKKSTGKLVGKFVAKNPRIYYRRSHTTRAMAAYKKHKAEAEKEALALGVKAGAMAIELFLRDMFACYALQGLGFHGGTLTTERVAEKAYKIADAMKAERKKTKGKKS